MERLFMTSLLVEMMRLVNSLVMHLKGEMSVCDAELFL